MESTLTVISIAMMVVAVLITVIALWAASRRARARPPSRPARPEASRDTARVAPPASIRPPASIPETDRPIPAPAASPPDAYPEPDGHAPRGGLQLSLRRRRRSDRRPVVTTSGTLAVDGGPQPAAVSLDAAVRTALGVEVRLGALGLDVPPMRQGREETVKVLISRAGDASAVIAALVAQSQVAGVEPVKTSAVMFVDLTGSSFLIRRLDATSSEQVVSDTATWEFQVTPLASGTQSLTVSASMRLPIPGHGERTVGVPSLRRQFQVEVDRLYASRAFVRRNWQWVGTSGIALVAVVAGVIWR